MGFDDGRLKVEKCPVCSGCHEYDLEFVRRHVAAYLTPGHETDDVATKVDIVLPCPEKGEDFQEALKIFHRLYERIDSVNSKLVED